MFIFSHYIASVYIFLTHLQLFFTFLWCLQRLFTTFHLNSTFTSVFYFHLLASVFVIRLPIHVLWLQACLPIKCLVSYNLLVFMYWVRSWGLSKAILKTHTKEQVPFGMSLRWSSYILIRDTIWGINITAMFRYPKTKKKRW